MAKGKMKVLTSAKAKEMGQLTPRFRHRLMNTRKLNSSTISRRADMSRVKLLELVLCVLV